MSDRSCYVPFGLAGDAAVAVSEYFKWPPRCTLRFWHETDDVDEDGEEAWGWLFESNDRSLDFFEAVMNGYDERRIRFEIETLSVRWPVWTEKALSKIEEHIRRDLDADGCDVEIARVEGEGRPCADGAMWELTMTDREAAD